MQPIGMQKRKTKNGKQTHRHPWFEAIGGKGKMTANFEEFDQNHEATKKQCR